MDAIQTERALNFGNDKMTMRFLSRNPDCKSFLESLEADIDETEDETLRLLKKGSLFLRLNFLFDMSKQIPDKELPEFFFGLNKTLDSQFEIRPDYLDEQSENFLQTFEKFLTETKKGKIIVELIG
jgi:hypothetical protein